MHYIHNEANWGPVIPVEVAQGSHFTFELPLRLQNVLVALRLNEGIHGESNEALYFPHGLIRFGESIESCVTRVVREIAGVDVLSYKSIAIEAWLDKDKHYHICSTILATINRMPSKGGNINDVIVIKPDEMLTHSFTWWSSQDIHSLFRKHWGEE